MSFLILLSLTAQLMPVSTECAAALLSFRYPSIYYMAESVFAVRLVNLRAVTCYTDQHF